ncbi:hypothetical protein [Pigmentiphaga kullae]|uniref:Uncharacterized protein n=1 Tax=Pigmentiphaga kullae TaxID=151784 RepID=A0A4Q7ND63_9BURK|nr:hypothetical protein [Pigmentiphaga kullae]RZS80607.1 hypothetical protein EV675_3219 [Pigmentiphaga kullae]
MSADDINLPPVKCFTTTSPRPWEMPAWLWDDVQRYARAAIQADRASRADHFRDATNLINESAAVLDVLTSKLPAGHRLRHDAEAGAKKLVAGLYTLADSLLTDAARSTPATEKGES